jgi:HSP20 family molecular chaperone IbpA
MSRISLTSHPFLLGFEQLDQLVERTAKSGADGYPPYNIEQRGDDAYRITLAVAGFADADLAITLDSGHLTVRGRRDDGAEGRIFLHRGIAARQFQRSFVLADRVEVAEARLDRGLLHIELVRRKPAADVQTIKIVPAGAESAPAGAGPTPLASTRRTGE